MRKRKLVLISVTLLAILLPVFVQANTVVTHLGVSPMKEKQANGEFFISIFNNDRWHEIGSLSFGKVCSQKEIIINRFLSNEEPVKIRLEHKGGGAAHIDSVFLGGEPPTEVNGKKGLELKKLSKKDFDVIDAFEKSIKLTFPFRGKDNSLRMTARVEPTVIGTTPFQFPLANLYRIISSESQFYTYKPDSERGGFPIDRNINQISAKKPFFREYSHTGSGHPSGFTYGWVMNDDEYLYVLIDFTPDNTMDGDKDYASVYVNTEKGVKEFKVSMPETRWGKPFFTYTNKVTYQHKIYEFTIPFQEMGIDTLNKEEELLLAFSAYGTAGPPEEGKGSIYIEKNTTPSDTEEIFYFTSNLGGFSLGSWDYMGFENQDPGTYNFTEGIPPGWVLTDIDCFCQFYESEENGLRYGDGLEECGATGDLEAATLTVDLPGDVNVYCAFYNTELGSITIVKDAVPDNAQLFGFTSALGSFTLDDDGVGPNSTTFTDLLPGSYDITENVTTVWNLTDITCTDPDGQTVVNIATATASIDLDPGESITCTFTNTQAPVSTARYTLRADVVPTGSGTVTGNGIACPADCSESYDEGTTVRLNAIPAPGYVFDHWGGCPAPRSQCDLIMNSDRSVTAHFRQVHILRVELIPRDGGRVGGTAGINCPMDCREDYSIPTTVTLTSQPNGGFMFTGWNGCDPGEDICSTQCTVLVEGEVTVQAIFSTVTGRSMIIRDTEEIFSTTWLLYIPVLEARLEGGQTEKYWMLCEYVWPGGYFVVIDYGPITCPIQTEETSILLWDGQIWRLAIPACDVEYDPDRTYWITLEVVFTDTEVRLNVLEYGLVE